jgi:hypothetical protein
MRKKNFYGSGGYEQSGNTTVAPQTLALRIVEGVGASLSEGEDADEDDDVGVGGGETESEFRF